MKMVKNCLIVMAVLFLLPSAIVSAGYEYKSYKNHKGGELTPVEAYRMVKADPEKTFLVDVRTRAEYQFVGHAEGAYNVPSMFLTKDPGKFGYKLTPNPDFVKELTALFNPETDTLLFYCKQGGRSLTAVEAVIGAGYPEARVFNILGGFEGELDRNRESIYFGKPYYGGWVHEGLPWTYHMDTRLMYQPDMKK